jgi:hypothetical protein
MTAMLPGAPPTPFQAGCAPRPRRRPCHCPVHNARVAFVNEVRASGGLGPINRTGDYQSRTPISPTPNTGTSVGPTATARAASDLPSNGHLSPARLRVSSMNPTNNLGFVVDPTLNDVPGPNMSAWRALPNPVLPGQERRQSRRARPAGGALPRRPGRSAAGRVSTMGGSSVARPLVLVEPQAHSAA